MCVWFSSGRVNKCVKGSGLLRVKQRDRCRDKAECYGFAQESSLVLPRVREGKQTVCGVPGGISDVLCSSETKVLLEVLNGRKLCLNKLLGNFITFINPLRPKTRQFLHQTLINFVRMLLMMQQYKIVRLSEKTLVIFGVLRKTRRAFGPGWNSWSSR